MKKSVKHKFQYLLFFLLSMPAFIFVWGRKRSVKVGVWHIGVEAF